MTSINDGLDELSRATRFYERHVSVSVRNLSNYYDLRGWLPESALGVTSVWSSVHNDWLAPVSSRDLKSRWEQAEGPSQMFFMRGLYWMVVWPKTATTNGFLRVYFSGYAPHFTHPQAVLLDLFDDMVPALEEYVMYDLSAKDGETGKALLYWGDYATRVKGLAKGIEKRIVTARVLKLGSQPGTRSRWPR